MSELNLTLNDQWFKLHQTRKKEEYREIKPYWCSRFLTCDGLVRSKKWWELAFKLEGVSIVDFVNDGLSTGVIRYRQFKTCIFHNGYKALNVREIFTKDILNLEIGVGDPDWGAPDEQVFIIKCSEIKSSRNIKK